MAVTPEQIEFEKSVRRLREKLHGKVISVNEAHNLMSRYDNDYDWVARTIIVVSENNPDNSEEDQDNSGNDGAVQDDASGSIDEEEENDEDEDEEGNEQSSNEGDQAEENEHEDVEEEEEEEEAHGNIELSEEDEDDDDAIKGIAERFRQLPLTAENLRLHNEAKRHQIPCRPRLFACPECKRSWWRKVPIRKEVSRCRMCKIRYDPVPIDLMWGYARFTCNNCNNTFRAYGQMGLPASCFGCRSQVVPTEIIPPRSRAADDRYQQPRMVAMRQQQRRMVMQPQRDHGCFAEDCYNRREPHIVGLHCIHPMTRRIRGLDVALTYSREHESSNSTIATCISQDDLLEDEDDIIQEDLERIVEED
ncbi:shiftless antiviral inhibitor of ribosomal frameshifting protein homolog [Protopterus annectens]|uniref:shiftless antiviral inhibitor of ribosomal frameshifting protein homolog n=1 Tax=Protopterus annectens TaxID=7888 RepID=UPI001CFBC9F1|nr:shiftless antiviral inhibitor of ribosomal frameshifting protein homolog [Protopterus annectens]